jgi:hypothetical protein
MQPTLMLPTLGIRQPISRSFFDQFSDQKSLQVDELTLIVPDLKES